MSDAPGAELLVVEKLSAGYGEAQVLFDIELTLAPGRSLALLGRNGVGKTTLVDSIIGVTRRRGGKIVLAGRDITAAPPSSGRLPASAGCRRSATSSSLSRFWRT